jgi:hypothetical protein
MTTIISVSEGQGWEQNAGGLHPDTQSIFDINYPQKATF